MFKEVFVNFSDGSLIALGFVLFMVTFLGTLIWTLFVQKKSFYNKQSELPLTEGDKYGQ